MRKREELWELLRGFYNTPIENRKFANISHFQIITLRFKHFKTGKPSMGLYSGERIIGTEGFQRSFVFVGSKELRAILYISK